MSHYDKDRDATYYNVKIKSLHFDIVTEIRRARCYSEVPKVIDAVNEAIEHLFLTKLLKHIDKSKLPKSIVEFLASKKSKKEPVKKAA